MRFLVINPNSDSRTNEILERIMCTHIREEDQFHIISLNNMALLIESDEDYRRAVSEVLNVVKEYSQDINGYDAFIIGCHSDPGVEAARKLVAQPVYGVGEASFLEVQDALVGIVVVSEESLDRKEQMARRFLAEDSYRLVVSRSGSYEDVLKASKSLIDLGAEIIILGCANYFGYDERLEEELHCPVINGLKSLLRDMTIYGS